MYKTLMEIGKLLGTGSFSSVYECVNNKGEKFAIKVEEKKEGYLLQKEAKIHFYLYKKDINNEFILPVHQYYEDENNGYLVIDKMFMSFGEIIKKIGLKFDDYSVRNIARKVISILEFIHKHGICHGDIKPDNILISRDYKKLYLIDFGLSKYYIKKGVHVSFRKKVSPSGTLRYMSFHVNKYFQMSRRDDLISFGYLMVYLQKLYLPWQNIDGKNKYEKVAEMKENINIEYLCDGCVSGLKEYLEYCYKLDFEDEPDYEYLLNFFRT